MKILISIWPFLIILIPTSISIRTVLKILVSIREFCKILISYCIVKDLAYLN